MPHPEELFGFTVRVFLKPNGELYATVISPDGDDFEPILLEAIQGSRTLGVIARYARYEEKSCWYVKLVRRRKFDGRIVPIRDRRIKTPYTDWGYTMTAIEGVTRLLKTLMEKEPGLAIVVSKGSDQPVTDQVRYDPPGEDLEKLRDAFPEIIETSTPDEAESLLRKQLIPTLGAHT